MYYLLLNPQVKQPSKPYRTIISILQMKAFYSRDWLTCLQSYMWLAELSYEPRSLTLAQCSLNKRQSSSHPRGTDGWSFWTQLWVSAPSVFCVGPVGLLQLLDLASLSPGPQESHWVETPVQLWCASSACEQRGTLPSLLVWTAWARPCWTLQTCCLI